jgi:hypothetical protein
MANSISITLGTTTISVPIRGTIVQVRAVLKRYAKSRGIPVNTLTDVQIGEEVLRALVRTIRDGSMTEQRNEIFTGQQAQLEQQLNTDNDIIEETL